MTQPAPDDEAEQAPPASADPTRQVPRPPRPGRAVRAEIAAGDRATPPVQPDEPTMALTGRAAGAPNDTLQYGTPGLVKVTVGPRPRRRHRTWPWIVAVVLALVVLGTVLLVMLLRGATIDPDTDLIGSGRHPAPVTAAPPPAGLGA